LLDRRAIAPINLEAAFGLNLNLGLMTIAMVALGEASGCHDGVGAVPACCHRRLLVQSDAPTISAVVDDVVDALGHGGQTKIRECGSVATALRAVANIENIST
jgi:hypothetical protein